MEKNINTFIKEIIPIIIGILIAMCINNWNENRKDKKYIHKMYESINRELVETNKEIIDVIKIQKSFIDTLDLYLNDNTISLLDLTIKAKGIHIPTIKLNSWKAISNSKIELMEYNKISALANIEEQKMLLKMKAEKLVSFIYSNTKETEADKKEFLKMMMLEIINTEIPLQNEIANIIDN